MADLIFKLVVSEDGKDVFTTPLSYEMVSYITDYYPDTSESDSYFRLASKHAASSVRERVAQKESLSPDVVATLSKDASIAVLRILVGSGVFRGIASQDLLEKLIKLDVEIAQTIAGDVGSYDQADADRLASVLAAIADPAVLACLAESSCTPPKVLKSLVNHPDLRIANAAKAQQVVMPRKISSGVRLRKPVQASIVQKLPSPEIVGEEREDEGGNRISIELQMGWLEIRVGEISDGATTRIIAGEEYYDDVIESECGERPDDSGALPESKFIKTGRTFWDVALKQKDLQQFKISINENEVEVDPGNILMIPLLNKDSPVLDKLEEMGFVPIGKLADHISNKQVIDQVTHLFHAHKYQAESFYGPIIAKNKNLFIWSDGWKGCYHANYSSKSPISLDDVRIIFFAEDNFVAGLTNTSVQNESAYFRNIRVGSYLAAIYVGKSAVDFYVDYSKDSGISRMIVKYTGEKRALIYDSDRPLLSKTILKTSDLE